MKCEIEKGEFEVVSEIIERQCIPTNFHLGFFFIVVFFLPIIFFVLYNCFLNDDYLLNFFNQDHLILKINCIFFLSSTSAYFITYIWGRKKLDNFRDALCEWVAYKVDKDDFYFDDNDRLLDRDGKIMMTDRWFFYNDFKNHFVWFLNRKRKGKDLK